MSTTQLQTPTKLCPECGSGNIIFSTDSGEQVCTSCGLVLREYNLDHGPEWRAYTFEENAERNRAGSPITILQPDKGLPTIIKDVNTDAYGKKISDDNRLKMLFLRRLQSQQRSPAERNLSQALAEMDRITDLLHIPESTKEEAAEIYRKALSMDLIRGRKIAAISAASLYAACRRTGKPRSLKEIASVCRVDMKSLTRSYRLLLAKLNLSMPIPDPTTYVSKIAAKTSIPGAIQVKAIEKIKAAEKSKQLTGKDPTGLAAAALYLSCVDVGERVTQQAIAEAAGVCELTVRNRYKALKHFLKQ